MEVAILIGLQASGKTTFYRSRLADTHDHVSKDNFPKARNRQRRQLGLIAASLEAGHNVAVDNTNPSPAEWNPIMEVARAHGASVVGYWFPLDVVASLTRNAARPDPVPDVGIYTVLRRLTQPQLSSGFDRLYTVCIGEGGFTVTETTKNGGAATGDAPCCRDDRI